MIFLDLFLFLLKLLKHVVDKKIMIKLSNLIRFIHYLWIYYKCTSVMRLQINKLYLFFFFAFFIVFVIIIIFLTLIYDYRIKNLFFNYG